MVDIVLFFSLLCSFICNLQKYVNIDDGARCNKIRGASCNTYVFFHFVSQEELTASKVILFAICKIDCKGKSFVFEFPKNL